MAKSSFCSRFVMTRTCPNVTLLSMMKSWVLLVGTCLACTAIYGQSAVGSATLNGSVVDSSGAAVPAAKVSVTNISTGFTRSVNTTDAGLYGLTELPIGAYELSVEKQGFKTLKRSGIDLAVGAVATIDLALEVGNAQDTVTVTAEAPVVETTRSQSSTVITTQAVAELPINGRNFLDFTVLTPGVTRDPTRTG